MRALAVSVMVMAATACAGERAQQLVVFTDMDTATVALVEERFEVAHPQVAVEMVRLAPAAALLRLAGAQEAPDVWWGVPAGILADAAARGLLVATHPSWAGQGSATVADAHDRWHGVTGTPFVFAFNRDQTARSDMPADWVDLFQPRLSGDVLLPDPQSHHPTGFLLGWWMVLEEDRTGDANAGFDWLLRLDGAVADYPAGVQDVLARLRAGDGSVAILPLSDVLAAMQDSPWLDYTVAESGSPLHVRGVAAVAAAQPNPLAENFVEGLAPEELPEGPRLLMADYARIEAGLTAWIRHWRQEIRGAAASAP